jgi:tRNA U55 pseudouridine synthase TruB
LFLQGRALGTVAHMTALRRTSIGDHHISEAWGLEEFQEAVHASRLRGPPEPETTSNAEEGHFKSSDGQVRSLAGLDSDDSEASSMPRALPIFRRVWEKWTSQSSRG